MRLQGFDYSDPNYMYSITLCARHLPQPFADPTLGGMVVESILFRAAENHWRVYAYCLMPHHLHLALSPVVGKGSLPSLIQGFKSYTTRMAWKLGRRGILWQRSYYDHIARREVPPPIPPGGQGRPPLRLDNYPGMPHPATGWRFLPPRPVARPQATSPKDIPPTDSLRRPPSATKLGQA